MAGDRRPRPSRWCAAPASTPCSPTCACRAWAAPRWSTRSGASTPGWRRWSSPPTPATTPWRRPGARGCWRCSPSRCRSHRLLELLGAARRDGLVAVVEDDPALSTTSPRRCAGAASRRSPPPRCSRPSGSARCAPSPRWSTCACRAARTARPCAGSRCDSPGLPLVAMTAFPAAAPAASRRHLPEALRHRRAARRRGAAPRRQDGHSVNLPSPARRSRVLVVDDNAALAENLAGDPRGGRLRGPRAGTCADALPAARGGLRRGAGGPAASRTATAPPWPRSSRSSSPDGEVVLLTGFATLESASRAVRAGACAYLVEACATRRSCS